MHRHEVEPTDALTQSTMRHGGPTSLTPVSPTAKAIFFGASYHADYATILAAPEVPARRRRGSRRRTWPRRRRRSTRTHRRGTSSTFAACAVATRPRTRSPTAFGRREIAEGWTLNVEREDVCPVVHLPAGARLRRVPLDARQEGAPRDPAQDPAGRGGRRHRAHRLDRSARRPRGLHRPPPAQVGRPGPVPADAGRRRVTALHPSNVRRVRAGRAAPARVPDRRRTAGRGRPPVPDRGRATSTTTPASTPMRATCRRGSSSSPSTCGGPSPRAGRGSTSCAATSPTSTSGAPSTSRSSGSSSGVTRRRWPADGRARPLGSLPHPDQPQAIARTRADPGRRGPRDRHRTAAPRSTCSG